MKNLLLLSAVLSSVMMLSGCEKDEEVFSSSLLNTEWTQSYEEQSSEEVEIYRPRDYKDFPPSWYRQTFYFEDNNVCKYSVLAPNDGHYVASGSWNYNEETKIIQVFNADSETLYELQVLELSANLLKVQVHQ